MRLITSPWADAFDHFGRSIQSQALLVAPFIAREPLDRLASILDSRKDPKIDLVTNLAVDSLLYGSVDAKGIASFCRQYADATVRHLPGLHAKAYVADDHLAIITSGNLTQSSLHHNYEYGVQIEETHLVRQISQDLRDYSTLGSMVSIKELERLSEIADKLRAKHKETLQTARASVRAEFEEQIETAQETLRYIRAKPGETTSAIFSRTILFILRNGPLTRQQIHPLVETFHPDLCDGSIDRVINGVHFGKRWKHLVRSAQQRLKARKLIEFSDGKWALVQENALGA